MIGALDLGAEVTTTYLISPPLTLGQLAEHGETLKGEYTDEQFEVHVDVQLTQRSTLPREHASILQMSPPQSNNPEMPKESDRTIDATVTISSHMLALVENKEFASVTDDIAIRTGIVGPKSSVETSL
jgi:hypothetical protein